MKRPQGVNRFVAFVTIGLVIFFGSSIGCRLGGFGYQCNEIKITIFIETPDT